MGFSDGMIVPARAVVPAPDIDPLVAALAEPCGVALDMVKVAEIGLTDRVLVVGVGAIGLMALAIARRLTAGVVVAANRSTAKLAYAAQLGADHVFSTREQTLAEMSTAFGGFDKILITAPPQIIPDAITAAAFGGYLVYIGSVSAEGGVIPLDTHALHFGKKQLRASFASPGIYLPQVLQLLRTGVVPADAIVSHRFPLSQIAEAIRVARDERDTARKILVIPERK
jgi:L-iditol 2-dehydrogenase